MNGTLSKLDEIRAEFPILSKTVNGHPLVYLDNAATTQKPQCVIEATREFYAEKNANVHRGVHFLSERATTRFDKARTKLRQFLNAKEDEEIIFTKGSTEAINLIASSWGKANIMPGDRILLTGMEHHANIVPWQMVAKENYAEIVPIPLDSSGQLDMDAYANLLDERVKLVGIVHVSNAIGTINPIKTMTQMAKEFGAFVVVDGSQASAHLKIDVQDLDVDFYCLTAHKMYGPTGIGAVYGRRELLEAMPPYQTGGGAIRSVTFEETTFAALPDKFEPGTPNIAGVMGWGAAIDFVSQPGFFEFVGPHEKELVDYATELLEPIPSVHLHGRADRKAGIVSFTMDHAHPHDIGTILDQHGVAIRAGHHCCQPLMRHFGVAATARASFAAYNTRYDVEQLAEAVRYTQRLIG